MKLDEHSMKIFIICMMFLLSSSKIFAQDTEESKPQEKKKSSFSILFGAAAGNIGIDASKFNDVYSNRSISRIYFAGIGGNNLYLIGKYRKFYAHGTSVVQNIPVTGKADWSQQFYCAGLRLRSDESPLYLDLLYVVTKAEEKITTRDQIVEDLTVEQKIENKGGGVALGLNITLLGPVKIFGEGEYSFMATKARTTSGKIIPELGGICVSAGVAIIL